MCLTVCSVVTIGTSCLFKLLVEFSFGFSAVPVSCCCTFLGFTPVCAIFSLNIFCFFGVCGDL